MTENEVAEAPAEESVEAPTEAPVEEQVEEKAEEPAQDEKVEIEDPKVQARLNQIYGEAKYAKEQAKGLVDHNRQLEGAVSMYAKKLEALESKVSSTQHKGTIDGLQTKLKSAIEDGEDWRAEELRQQISDTKSEMKELSKRPEPRPQPPQQQRNPFSPVEEEFIIRNKDETDPSGNFIRPWMQDGHPRNAEATMAAEDLVKDNPSMSIRQVMKELDSEMGVGKVQRPGIPNTIGKSSLTAGPKKGRVSLTDAEKDVARKLGVSEDSYAKQKALIQGAQ